MVVQREDANRALTAGWGADAFDLMRRDRGARASERSPIRATWRGSIARLERAR